MEPNSFGIPVVLSRQPEIDPMLLEALGPLGSVAVENRPPDRQAAVDLITELAAAAMPPRLFILPESEEATALAGHAAAWADLGLIVGARGFAVEPGRILVCTEGERADRFDEWELPPDRPALIVMRAGEPWDMEPQIVVSAGGGCRDRETLDLIEAVAARLGAELSCSRPIVESGLLPARHLVGVSGATINPDLCLAFGISGADPHLAGIRARHLAAVDRDPAAHVFRAADVALAADVVVAADALIEAVER